MMKSALFASLIFAPSALASVVIPGGALTLDQVTVWPDCNDPGQETPFQGCKNGADPWSDCSNGGGGGNGNGQGNNGQGNSATDPSPTDPTNVSPTDPTTDASPTTGNNANGNSNGNSNGRRLQGSSPECHKINICHGNAHHWNAITVDRDSLNSNNGHAVANHNNRNRKLPDFLPGAGAIRNPRGAGQGYIDGNCQFVCDTGDCTYDCGGSSHSQVSCLFL
ncbi:expressed unknown protein [Seminavis robusta]|uniref:Secreted protein n=1 Tax=Seminavis robusta TaxID=568900 RepID=A0A9N8HMR9_9STRA|nr:expressed unknown protein [Seminavis robusta]|eukprot:Sro926_g221050.1 n/a (222) ;mRNA; r:25341-26073